MRHTSIVAVNGSLSSASRTGVLIESLASSVSDMLPGASTQVIELGRIGGHLASTLGFDDQSPQVAQALEQIRTADLLIAASPVYKGGYTGLFKHLFDLLDTEALVGKPVLLAATGGSERHSLVVDHVFRPLFSFFRAYTVPSAVYASTGDFREGQLLNTATLARVGEAAAQAAVLVRGVSVLPVPLVIPLADRLAA